MSLYTKKLYEFINNNGFVRCFYGTCPNCGANVFSVGDDVVDNRSIKAKFICDCGKKWRETVYSPEMKMYKYRQAVGETIWDKKLGDIKVLRFFDKYILVRPDRILSKEIKPKKGEH